jgi:hypothetical protein
MRFLTVAGVAIAAALASAPAAAVVTTFASFSPIGNGANIRFVNTGNTTSAALFSTSTAIATTAGARSVNFSFLQASLSPFVTNVTASFNLGATVTNTAATVAGGTITQSAIAGSFSFLSTKAITIGTKTFAIGSNLLSGTFTNNAISGTRNGSAAGFTGSTPSSTIVYTSDFLNFVPGSAYDMSLSLSSVLPGLNALPIALDPTRALRTFRAVTGGTFSSDPAPIPIVPEPAVWAQLIAGFALVGFASRRRRIAIAA